MNPGDVISTNPNIKEESRKAHEPKASHEPWDHRSVFSLAKGAGKDKKQGPLDLEASSGKPA